MLKNSTYKLVVIMFSLLSVLNTSCNKWLDLAPQDGLTRDEYWKSKEQLDAAVMGCYASLLGGSGMPLAKYLFLWGELRGDMVSPAIDPSSESEFASLNAIKRDEVSLIRTDISSTNIITNWEAVYKTINYCNTVIKYGPAVINNDKTLSQSQLNGYLGEAYGLRGLMYFYLLRTFGEVPLKLVPTATDADAVSIQKSSKEEVYKQIKSDVDFAVKNCLPAYTSQEQDKGRINLYTAYALQADVFLWGEEYQACIEACDKIIQSGKYRLFPAMSSQDDWYHYVFYQGNSAESLFEFQFYQGKLNPFMEMFGGTTSKELIAAEWITIGNLYGIDTEYPDNKDIRASGTSFLETNSAINKFIGGRGTATSFTHWFVYRYSDVLLMKAEALAWLAPGNEANGRLALDIVNDIRVRRNAFTIVGERTIEEPQPGESQKVSEYILDERAREFAFEGKRWFDVLRNAKRNNYQNDEVLMDMVKASAPPAKQQIVVNKYKDRRSHYLPIYFYELQTNRALVQNPFYQ